MRKAITLCRLRPADDAGLFNLMLIINAYYFILSFQIINYFYL